MGWPGTLPFQISVDELGARSTSKERRSNSPWSRSKETSSTFADLADNVELQPQIWI